MYNKLAPYLVLFLVFFSSCGTDEPEDAKFVIEHVYVGSVEISMDGSVTTGIPIDQSIALQFSSAVDEASVEDGIILRAGEDVVTANFRTLNNGKTVVLTPSGLLNASTLYTLEITDGLQGKGGQSLTTQTIQFKTTLGNLNLVSVLIDNTNVLALNPVADVPLSFSATLNFSIPVNPTSLRSAVSVAGPTSASLQFAFSNEDKTVVITRSAPLRYLSKYILTISSALKGAEGESYTASTKTLYTEIDYSLKMPQLANDEDDDNDNTNDLLSVVQKQTFKYFWEGAEQTSGMARERNGANYVTSGGSGFGIMALIVGMERNFVSKDDGLARMDKILTFLEGADRFHGAWPHWMHSDGNVLPFSPNDNGGDLVETAFLVQGLITFRQYITTNAITNSYNIVNRINTLWEAVEWDWYRQNNQDVLYWHWSEDKGWIMNHQISGWNEALIVYVLAASAPANNTITKPVYEKGWARNGAIRNGNMYEGVTLPLGFPSGGPLFFTHYSWLGLDPRTLSDQYASSYWTQNVNHSIINYKYCVRNPKQYAAYSEDCWGLTASDSYPGYSAHSPTNDLGVISPTAALSSFPYTPEESMRALKFFYYTMGDRVWGEYGFYDAFDASENWYANSYLAIDQGPIIVMIENYRTQKLWNLFMSAQEVKDGLDKLGFEY